MLVKISYTIKEEKVLDLTPEEVCYLHSGQDKLKYVPTDAIDWNYNYVDKEAAEEEMLKFFFDKKLNK